LRFFPGAVQLAESARLPGPSGGDDDGNVVLIVDCPAAAPAATSGVGSGSDESEAGTVPRWVCARGGTGAACKEADVFGRGRVKIDYFTSKKMFTRVTLSLARLLQGRAAKERSLPLAFFAWRWQSCRSHRRMSVARRARMNPASDESA
jgi:hypothetical protein